MALSRRAQDRTKQGGPWEAVVSLEAGEGQCAILWVSWAAVSWADRLKGWPGAGGWQCSVEGSVTWGPLPVLAVWSV